MRVATYRCDHRASRPLFAGRSIVRCSACGLAQVDVAPSASALHDYYAATYRTGSFNAGASLERFPKDNVWYLSRGRALRELALRHAAPAHPSAGVLDVGAGFGHVLWAFREALPAARLVACEPDASCAPFLAACGAATLPLFLDDDAALERLRPHAPFHFVVLAHVLEHVRDPVAFLARIGGLVAAAGALVVEVPNSPHGDLTWVSNHAPHLTFFTPDTLRACIERAGGTTDFADTCGPPLPSQRPALARQAFRIASLLPLPIRSTLGRAWDRGSARASHDAASTAIPLPSFAEYGGEGRTFVRAIARFPRR